jgi:hypothetical protein
MGTQADQSRDPLYAAASLIKHAVGADDKGFNLNHFYYDGKGTLVGTDSHRLATVAVDLGSEQFMFPVPVNGAWKSWQSGQFKPTLIKNTEEEPNACDYPNYRTVLPTGSPDIEIALKPMELLAVKRFYGNRLWFELTAGNLRITDAQGHKAFEIINIPVDHDGPDKSLVVNRNHLLDELNGKKGMVKIGLSEDAPKAPIVFRYPEIPNYLALVMPVNASDSPQPLTFSRDMFCALAWGKFISVTEKNIFAILGESKKTPCGLPKALIRQWIKELLNEGRIIRTEDGTWLAWQGEAFEAAKLPLPEDVERACELIKLHIFGYQSIHEIIEELKGQFYVEDCLKILELRGEISKSTDTCGREEYTVNDKSETKEASAETLLPVPSSPATDDAPIPAEPTITSPPTAKPRDGAQVEPAPVTEIKVVYSPQQAGYRWGKSIMRILSKRSVSKLAKYPKRWFSVASKHENRQVFYLAAAYGAAQYR